AIQVPSVASMAVNSIIRSARFSSRESTASIFSSSSSSNFSSDRQIKPSNRVRSLSRAFSICVESISFSLPLRVQSELPGVGSLPGEQSRWDRQVRLLCGLFPAREQNSLQFDCLFQRSNLKLGRAFQDL